MACLAESLRGEVDRQPSLEAGEENHGHQRGTCAERKLPTIPAGPNHRRLTTECRVHMQSTVSLPSSQERRPRLGSFVAHK